MNILVLNAGSSSHKIALYRLADPVPPVPAPPLWAAQVDWSHHPGQGELAITTQHGAVFHATIAADPTNIIAPLLNHLWSGPTQVIQHPADIDVVGHRVVHGGRDYRTSVVIDGTVQAVIDRLATFAPAHNPANLAGIRAVANTLGNIRQIAVFDTAFHTHLPLAAAVYPIPYEWFAKGIQRYGFHGISHDYCAQRTAQILGRDRRDLRLITCHLGNGCSLAAIREGHSIDTTMGFTPLEGLMMGSRSGSIDPGILIHLLRHENYTADQLDQMLNHASGLQGISGQSGDMRQILAAIAHGDPQAQLAFDVYIHRLRAQIGAMLANLGGLDALVFTAGVGEHAPAVRAAVCNGWGFLGIQIDPALNVVTAVDQDISPPTAAVRVVVVHTQEDWAIALECFKLLND
jgi:acetate kinase